MAKKETPVIGLIDATTPVGSILTMEKGKADVAEQYWLVSRGADDSMELAGIGEAKELVGVYTYADWNEEYAPFVTEIKYPESTAVPADCARTDLPAAQGHIAVPIANSLDWVAQADGEGFMASSEAWRSTEGGLWWRVTKRKDGKWDIGESDNELIGDGILVEYAAAPAAKAFCEKEDAAQLAEILAAAPAEFGIAQPISVPASTMEAVEEANAEFRFKDNAYECLADHTKAAKKERDAAQEALNAAVNAMLDGELIREDGFLKDSPLAVAADEKASEEATPFDDAEEWKAVELADLKDPHIKVGILKTLAKNDPPIKTMGDLTKWQEAKQDFWAKDLKGVGQAACDSISDATDAYWTRNPRPAADEPFAPPAE